MKHGFVILLKTSSETLSEVVYSKLNSTTLSDNVLKAFSDYNVLVQRYRTYSNNDNETLSENVFNTLH